VSQRVSAGLGRLPGDRRSHRAGKNGGDQETEGHHEQMAAGRGLGGFVQDTGASDPAERPPG